MFHALTRVDINVTNVDKATGMTITVFTMGSLLDGKRPLPYDNEEWNLLTGGSGILTKVTCIPTRLPYSPATDGTKTNLATFFVMPIRKGLAYKPSFKIAYTTPGNVPSGEAPVQTIEWNDKIPSPETWTMGAHTAIISSLRRKNSPSHFYPSHMG